MKSLQLNGMDFLLMAQNGTLKIQTDSQGNITGINIDDNTLERFDGMLVALHQHTQLLMDSSYTLIVKDIKPGSIPQTQMENMPIIENKED